MIVIHFNLWHESSSPLFLPGLFVNVLAALLASGGAALTLKETINQIPVLVLNGVAATSLLLGDHQWLLTSPLFFELIFNFGSGIINGTYEVR